MAVSRAACKDKVIDCNNDAKIESESSIAAEAETGTIDGATAGNPEIAERCFPFYSWSKNAWSGIMPQFIKSILLSLHESTRNVLKTLLASFGIIFLISFIVLYIVFRDSVQAYLDQQLFGNLAINELVIRPRGATGFEAFSPTSPAHNINPYHVDQIRRLPEMERVFSVIRLDYATKVRAEMMGKEKKMYMPICGIEPGFFEGKDPNWRRFHMRTPVPVIAPKFALEMFNNFLSLNGFPQMSTRDLYRFPLDLFVITSPHDAEKEVELKMDGEVHGFTDQFSFPGIIVPSDFIVDFARRHQNDFGRYKKGYHYIILYARVKDVKTLPDVVARIRSMGLDVQSQNDVAEKTNKAMSIIDTTSFAIVGILLLITVISIFNSYLNIVYTRTQKFSLQRVLGVSKLRIISGFVVEAVVVGLIYGLLGYYLGSTLVHYVTINIEELVPVLKGIVIQPIREGLLVQALLASMGISALSALVPAVFASNINLFKAVRRQ